MIYYYIVMAIISIVLLIISFNSEKNKINIYITGIILLSAIANLGYLAIALSNNESEAILGNKIIYIGGCFMPLFLFFTIINICNFTLPNIVKHILEAYSFVVYGFVLSIGYSDFYYESVTICKVDGVTVIDKVYGPGHSFSTILLYGYIVISIIVLAYAFVRKKNVSYKTLIALCLIYLSNVVLFIASRAMDWDIEVTPVTYVIAGIILLVIQGKIEICNVENSISLSGMSQQIYGYIVIDKNKKYMGSNNLAKSFIGELENLKIERPLSKENDFFIQIDKWISIENSEADSYEYHNDNIHLICNIRKMYRNKRLFAYVVEMKDDSQRWNYVKLLEESRIKADAANQAKTTFLAHMSHEIRAPINAVMGMSEMILRESREPEIYGYAKDVNNAAKSLLSIINDVLDVAKIEAGKLEIIPNEYNTLELLKDVYYMVSFRAEGKSIKLEVDIDKKLPKALYGDDVRIKQILINLLSNSIKYTHTGKVVFKIEKLEGNEIRYTVTDTGIGIKPEDIYKLFKPFERIEEERNHNIEGTGLGIPITIQLLDMMGSKLEVESEYGKGSKFSFTINQGIVDENVIGKVDIRKTEVMPIKNHTVSLKLKGVKALIVDDNPVNRKVAISLLKGTDIVIDEAADGYECIEKAKSNNYDILFIDHMMPGIDGIETLNKLNRLGIAKDIPKIMLTANAMAGERERYIECGFDEFLAKPIDTTELIHILTKFLSRKLYQFKQSVLLIDDSTAWLRNICEKIKSKYKVYMVNDCEKALLAIEKNLPDIIMLDYDMSGILVEEMLIKLRSIEKLGEIPIILLTEKDSENEVEKLINKKEIMELNVKGYIVKNDDEIIDKLAIFMI